MGTIKSKKESKYFMDRPKILDPDTFQLKLSRNISSQYNEL